MDEHRGNRPFIASWLLAVPVLSSMRPPLRGVAGRWWGVGRWTGGWLAPPRPAATSRPGPSLAAPALRNGVSQGQRGFLVSIRPQFPLRPVSDKHLIVAGVPTTPQENKTLVALCGVDAIAGGRAIIVTIVGAGFFPLAPSKRRRNRRSVGVWVERILHCAAGRAWEIGQIDAQA